MITSNLNVRSSNWLDLDGQNVEGYEITSIMYLLGQFINPWIHLKNLYFRIFATSPNLNKIVGAEMSLLGTYHHNLLYDIKSFYLLPNTHII